MYSKDKAHYAMTVEVKAKTLQNLKEQQKALEKSIESLEGEIKDIMVKTETYEFQGVGWKVTWNMVCANRFNQSAFQADHPKLYERYRFPSESRRFLLS